MNERQQESRVEDERSGQRQRGPPATPEGPAIRAGAPDPRADEERRQHGRHRVHGVAQQQSQVLDGRNLRQQVREPDGREVGD